jgi:hypothetical protein
MIVDCRRCGALVDGQFVKSYLDADPSEEPANKYSMLHCPKCMQPFLVVENEYLNEPPQVLYPSIPQASLSVPKPIREAIEEAQACFRAKAYTATAIMCRKTLEGLSVAHDVRAKGLLAALRELKDRGVIEQRLFEWADALRISGNEAAHDVDVSVAAEDARDLLEFSTALLEYVFTFRDRFEAFKNRRSQAKASNPPTQSTECPAADGQS